MSAQASTLVVDTGMWWLSLGLGAVVIVVVAVLLHLVVASARRIRGTVAEIWVAGPLIANNTAHLDILREINLVAADILGAAGRIESNAARLGEHAAGCPGCPRCVTGWSQGG